MEEDETTRAASLRLRTLRRVPARVVAGLATLAVLLVVAAVVVTGAGQPRPRVSGAAAPAPRPGMDLAVLTPQGDDSYLAEGTASSLEVRARPGNEGGNLRVAVTEEGTEPLRDQQVCGSWSGSLRDGSQPGLALRVRTEDGRTRAITVTNNVFADVRWRWNVHTWDGDTGTLVGQANLFAAFGRAGLTTLPWSMCARVVGDDLSFVAWPTERAAPRWSDPARSAHVELPAGWEEPGRPGWYAGHLVPGGSVRLTDLATWDLTGTGAAGPGPDRPPS